jgi:hypothetical protein
MKLNFDSKVSLEFRGASMSSDIGLVACRELDDALSLTDSANDEGRMGKKSATNSSRRLDSRSIAASLDTMTPMTPTAIPKTRP